MLVLPVKIYNTFFPEENKMNKPPNLLCFRFYEASPDLIGKPFKEGDEVLGNVVRIEGDVVTVAVEDDEKYKEIMNKLESPALSMGCQVKNV